MSKRLIGYVIWNDKLDKPVAARSGRGTPRLYKHEARADHEAVQFSPRHYARPVYIEETT